MKEMKTLNGYEIVDEKARGGVGFLSTYVTPEMFGAKGDGVTDDTEAIQAMFDAVEQHTEVRFKKATYCISRPITLNKKYSIDGCGCTIEATANMESMFYITNNTSTRVNTIQNIFFKGNLKAKYCLNIGGSDYNKCFNVNKCYFREAHTHGVCFSYGAYLIQFTECTAYNCGGDGFNAVCTTPEIQYNAIMFVHCNSFGNVGNGFRVNGVNFAIEQCNADSNNIGIYVGGETYATYGINISDCYMELNKQNQIYIASYQYYSNVNIERNYFYTTKVDEEVGKIVLVKCRGTANTLILHHGDNIVTVNGDYIEVDGGDTLTFRSNIRARTIANTRLAKLDMPVSNGVKLWLPMVLSTKVKATSNVDGPNLVGETDPRMVIMAPYEFYNSVITSVGGAIIRTGGSDATLEMSMTIYDAVGAIFKTCAETFTLTTTNTYTMDVTKQLGYVRIPDGCLVQITYKLTSAGSCTKVQVCRPFITKIG